MSVFARDNRRGFTIVELLVVIVVIGILAAITIVAYNGVQQRAKSAAVQSDLANAFQKMALDNASSGSYALTAAAVDSGNGLPASNGTTYQFHSTGNTFCITGTNGTASYMISNTAGAPVAGGCPGDGQGGVAAITNLAANPSVEFDGTNWAARWFGGGGAGTTALTPAAALYGSNGYRKTWTTGGGGQDIGFQYIQPVTAGKTYTLSAYVRASVVTGHKAFAQWQDASNTTLSTINGPEISVPVNTWQRLSVSGTAPTNAVRVVFVWGPYPGSGSPASVAGQTIDFDGLMVTEGSTLYNYADGNSPNWIWNGTTNSSTSTGPPQ